MGPTLVLCPLSVLGAWKEQLEGHSSKPVKIFVYHGANRKNLGNSINANFSFNMNASLTFLMNQDVVLTTYNTLCSEHKDTSTSPLFNLTWWRVVLDEAHYIKSKKTLQSQAAFALDAINKWCLTGTPVINNFDDIYSYVNFLKIEPFSDFNWFSSVLMKAIKAGEPAGLSTLQLLMKSVCIRRTKDLIQLPAKNVYKVTLNLSPEEMK
jgi:SNF2 family DNA or RNA helicase